jgi:hypothetical protein
MDGDNMDCGISERGSCTIHTPPTIELDQLQVRDYQSLPMSLNVNEKPIEEADQIDIRVVGVGPLGNEMVQILPRYLYGVWCHEVFKDSDRESTSDLKTLLSSVSNSTLSSS